MQISLGSDRLGDFETSSHQEWLETNGLGGFASGTVAGANTRRYHGLLVAATRPPLGRVVTVAQLHETVALGADSIEISSAQYPGAVHPHGYKRLARFELAPSPTWTYQAGAVRLVKRVMMLHGRNLTAVSYRVVEAPGRVTLSVRPALACRDYHALARENSGARREAGVRPGSLAFQPYPGVPAVHVGHPGGTWRAEAFWYRDNEYLRELDRGLDYKEDLLSPGTLELQIEPGGEVTLAIGMEPVPAGDVQGLVDAELSRREGLSAGARSPLEFWLRRAADQFLARRGAGGRTVIAGYPWFTDWGRDTFISLPGLTLCTGRIDVARELLETFGAHLDRGVIPNRFPDAGEVPEYNTVDASLWYVWAAERVHRAAPDMEFARRVIDPAVQAIVAGYQAGTHYHIKMAEDGLVTQGAPGVALTWMDARFNGSAVTPRTGKPVEINALWYNALAFAGELAEALRGPAEARALARTAALVRASFQAQFWSEEHGYLFDVIDGAHRDASLRPNQLVALALPRPLLAGERARSALGAVERALLTPRGLRSLAPGHAKYVPRYEGGWEKRDGCYHQGTVWGWLIGPYCSAVANVLGRGPEARAKIAAAIAPFEAHLTEYGLGSIGEIFDADAPHRPAGCIAQAWSVAETLRVVVEELS